MEHEKYIRVKDIFLEACDLPPDERSAFLDRECGGDDELRAEVESLLKHETPTDAEPAMPSALKSQVERISLPPSIGPYKIIRELGRGGMGVVYLGERTDDRFKRRVAIKVLKRGMDTDEVLRRFDLERQVLAAMNHPGIARLYDAGETNDGTPYFVMEYVEGQPINEYCDIRRLTIDERLELFRQVCFAVHHAHQNLVVHRDLKPSNIVVTKEDQPKLLDFGIAKLINPQLAMISGTPTAPEFRVMTPEYASPEQVRGTPITTASDVYSLGVLLYELVSGHRPYHIRSRIREELERIICEEDPEKPSTAISRVEEADPTDPTTTTSITPESVGRSRESRPERLRRRLSGDIDNIVLMAMRKEPQRRYASAEQLAEDIQRHNQGLPVLARPDTASYRMRKFIQRNKGGVIAAAVIALLLAAVSIASTWGFIEVKQARDIEEAARIQAQEESERAERRFGESRKLARTFMFDFYRAIYNLDGSLPARELIIETAVDYLEGVSRELGDDDVELMRELATGYDRIGDIRGGIKLPSYGDIPDALEYYQRAKDIRDELLKAIPDDPELLQELSFSYDKIGHVYGRTGKTSEALDFYRESLRIRKGLVTGDVQSRRRYASALLNVGSRLAKLGKHVEALEYYFESLELRKQLATENPDNQDLQLDIATAYLYIGGRYDAMCNEEDALMYYQQAHRIRSEVFQSNPNNSEIYHDYSVSLYFVGRSYLRTGSVEEAIPILTQYLEIKRRLERNNPNLVLAKRNLASAFQILGDAYRLLEDWDQANENYRSLLSVIEPVAMEYPEDTQYQFLLAVGYEGIGLVNAGRGNHDGAIENASQARNILQALVDQDNDNTFYKDRLAHCYATLGSYFLKSDQIDEARSNLENAVELFNEIDEITEDSCSAESDLSDTLLEFSKFMVRIGDKTEALRYAREAFKAAIKPSVELLRDLAFAHYLNGNNLLAIDTASEALEMLGEDSFSDEQQQLYNTLKEDLELYRDQ